MFVGLYSPRTESGDKTCVKLGEIFPWRITDFAEYSSLYVLITRPSYQEARCTHCTPDYILSLSLEEIRMQPDALNVITARIHAAPPAVCVTTIQSFEQLTSAPAAVTDICCVNIQMILMPLDSN